MDSGKSTAKLLRKVKAWHSDWTEMPMARRLHWAQPASDFEGYVRDDVRGVHMSGACESLQAWHLVHFNDALLNKGRLQPEEFALSARYAHASVKFNEAYADAGRGGSVLLRNAGLYLSMNILAGWQAEAASIGNALVKGLDTPMLDLRHNEQHQAGLIFRNFWFVIELYCSSRLLPLDLSKYSYPHDMSPYADVLADWRTNDLDKVHRQVLAMADFHLHEARNVPSDQFAEFDNEDVALFPHEILTWLRLREWAGLQNPASFDHPLMKLPTAQLPNPVPLTPPDTPMLDAVVAKFRQEVPGSFEP